MEQDELTLLFGINHSSTCEQFFCEDRKRIASEVEDIFLFRI